MKNKSKYSIIKIAQLCLLGAMIFIAGCKSDYVPPHEATSKGGFVRFEGEPSNINFALDLTESDNPSFEADLVAPGGNVTSYDLNFTLVSPQKTIGPFNLLSLTSFPTKLSFTTQQLADAASIPIKQLKGTLNFSATVTNDEGIAFTSADFTGDLSNPGQRQAMQFSLATVCPSSLSGTYSSTTTGTSTDGCCPNETTIEGTVTLTEIGKGQYTISDWSVGLYLEWYSIYGISATTDMTETLIDACGSISIASFAEPFGATTNATGGLEEATGIITYSWENGFGDQAAVVLTPN